MKLYEFKNFRIPDLSLSKLPIFERPSVHNHRPDNLRRADRHRRCPAAFAGLGRRDGQRRWKTPRHVIRASHHQFVSLLDAERAHECAALVQDREVQGQRESMRGQFRQESRDRVFDDLERTRVT